MTIQFNTDKTINSEERLQNYYTTLLEEKLKRFKDHITRIEFHLSDDNGTKEGVDNLQCLLEARLEGRQPIVVTCKDDTIEQAILGAIEKLQNAVETIIGRIKNH